jgi:excisionase family DNA binding protein
VAFNFWQTSLFQGGGYGKEMTKKRILSTGEVAKILGVHIDTVRRYCDSGELRFEKGLLSTHRRIRPEELEVFMLNRGVSEEAIIKYLGTG